MAVTTCVSATAQDLSGVYVGHYSTIMNAHKDNGVNGTSWPENTLDGEYNGEKYKILGTSVSDGIWVWNFDNNTVTVSGSTLFAMGMLHVPFQAFAPTEIENKRSDSEVIINTLDEITIPMEYEPSSGTYKISYAQKKYIVPPFPVPGVADYPIALTTTHLKVSKKPDGSLEISTQDVESSIAPDNVPGTRIENVFPATIQVEYRANNMRHDPLTDTNNDGITDAVATLLGLDPVSGDSDGDNLDDIVETPIYLRGKDSDKDGLSDALEAGTAATEKSIASGLKLQSEQRITILMPDGQRVYNVRSHPLDLTIADHHTLSGTLPPETNAEGEILDYKYGHATFNIDNPAKDETLKLHLELTKMPKGLEIYRVEKGFSLESMSFVQAFVKQDWTSSNGEKLELTLSNPDKSEAITADLIFAAPQQRETNVSPTPTPTPEQPSTASSSSSGGGLPLLSLLFLGAISLRRFCGHRG